MPIIRATSASGLSAQRPRQPNAPPLANGGEFYMAISPDERRLAFTALGGDGENRLWIRDMDRVEVRVIPGTERARSLFWSPDSRFVGFAQDNRLKR